MNGVWRGEMSEPAKKAIERLASTSSRLHVGLAGLDAQGDGQVLEQRE